MIFVIIWNLRTMARRYCRLFGCRKNLVQMLFLVALILLAYVGCWWSSRVVSGVLTPPHPPDQNLDHFRRSRSLKHYLDNIQLLIEPSSSPCEGAAQVPVMVVVTSAPARRHHRDAIRSTWARRQPTVFFMGLDGHHVDEQLVDSYMEAKQHSDIVVLEFRDHYQNLTLKTALMLRWALRRCPRARFLLKTDDDVFVNPWTLEQVLHDNSHAQLIGYRYNNVTLHRDAYNKWYTPRWLCRDDRVDEYLSGTGYIINGKYLQQIYDTSFKVPLLNLEDVYLTYAVAKQTLGLKLTHDRRLSPYKPWLSFGCAFWTNACTHSHEPDEIYDAWSKIAPISKQYEDSAVCSVYSKYFSSELFLY